MLLHKLKQRLFDEVKHAYPNMYSIERVNYLCDELGYKRSNGERRLRELCEADDSGYAPVRKVESEKGYIMGYIFIPPSTAVREERSQDVLFKMRPNALLV